jgi:alpha-glucosidase
LLTLRGTPTVYEGEELGLEDAVVPVERVVDPGGRDGCRAPIPWTPNAPHGWPGAEPWLPLPPRAGERSVAALTEDDSSILYLYRRLLAARRASPALHSGDLTLLDAPDGVLAYEREHRDDRRTVLVNFTAVPQPVDLRGIVEVSTDGQGEGEPFGGTLRPDEAVVIR